VPEPNPWLGVEGMVTRQYPGHPEYGQWNMDERLDIETVIQIFTRNGAMGMEKEDETGTIEVGKSADFIVIDQNILEVPVEKIHKTKVLQTVLQGKTVYKK
jgi:predicted amidohydrolase YtcJ